MNQWVDAKGKLPEPGTEVLATYKGYANHRCIVVAEYIPKHSREMDYDNDELEEDYDDYTETAYWPAGWYECVASWEEYQLLAIGYEVTHWMPLPKPPEDKTVTSA